MDQGVPEVPAQISAGEQKASIDTTRSRVANKRPAEGEADDSGRGDRADWRIFVEASLSSQAPGPPPPEGESRSAGTTGGPESGNVISDVATTLPVQAGGTKRPQ